MRLHAACDNKIGIGITRRGFFVQRQRRDSSCEPGMVAGQFRIPNHALGRVHTERLLQKPMPKTPHQAR